MKLKTTISALALCTCILLTACEQQSDPVDTSQPAAEMSKPAETVSDNIQPTSKYADYIETDISKLEDNGELGSVLESGLGSFCGHKQEYHGIHSYVSELVDKEKNDAYINEHGWGVEAFDIVDFVKYADISKEDYIASVNKYYPPDSEDADVLKEREKILSDIEIIYCGDQTKIDNYFNENDGSYNLAENETEPTKNFFTIHGALMRYVGGKKYHAYLERIFGTKYDNVKNFIEYFKIDRSTFEEIMKTAEASDFYNIDDLF